MNDTLIFLFLIYTRKSQYNFLFNPNMSKLHTLVTSSLTSQSLVAPREKPGVNICDVRLLCTSRWYPRHCLYKQFQLTIICLVFLDYPPLRSHPALHLPSEKSCSVVVPKCTQHLALLLAFC